MHQFLKKTKYCIDRFSKITPYISIRDINKNKYAFIASPIGPGNIQDHGEREVMVEYENIRTLSTMVGDWKKSAKLT